MNSDGLLTVLIEGKIVFMKERCPSVTEGLSYKKHFFVLKRTANNALC